MNTTTINTATLKIINATTSEVVMVYEIDYIDGKHLNNLFQEWRKNYPSHQVVIETPSYELSYSHTYNEQMSKN